MKHTLETFLELFRTTTPEKRRYNYAIFYHIATRTPEKANRIQRFFKSFGKEATKRYFNVLLKGEPSEELILKLINK